jgi:hypothetical protein
MTEARRWDLGPMTDAELAALIAISQVGCCQLDMRNRLDRGELDEMVALGLRLAQTLDDATHCLYSKRTQAPYEAYHTMVARLGMLGERLGDAEYCWHCDCDHAEGEEPED